jgi:Na+-driven multidrug efflux pump
MFNNDAELVSLGKVAIRIVTIMIPLVGVQILSASLFQAIGKAGPALVVSMSRQTLFLIPLVLLLPKFNNLGLIGIYAAFPLADVLAIILSVYLLKREVNSLKAKHLLIETESTH